MSTTPKPPRLILSTVRELMRQAKHEKGELVTLRKALGFYAPREHYVDSEPADATVLADGGATARRALGVD